MAKRHEPDPILSTTLPSRKIPLLVIILLITCMVFGFKYFFGQPHDLLGGPPPNNEYLQQLRAPIHKARPKPAPKRAASPARRTPPPTAARSGQTSR